MDENSNLYSWGDNWYGQLGVGDSHANEKTDRYGYKYIDTPTKISFP